MTFQEFQATRTWSDDLAAAVQSAPWGEDGAKCSGQLYLGCFYIEAAHSIEGATGPYCLTIGREIKFGELEDLERELYDWAMAEGYGEE